MNKKLFPVPSFEGNEFPNVWYRENGDVLTYAQESCKHCLRKPAKRVIRLQDNDTYLLPNINRIGQEVPLDFILDLLEETDFSDVEVETSTYVDEYAPKEVLEAPEGGVKFVDIYAPSTEAIEVETVEAIFTPSVVVEEVAEEESDEESDEG